MGSGFGPLPPKPREQMEDAAFWVVREGYGVEYWPIDGHAVYGRPPHGDRGVPVRGALRDLTSAIRAVRPGDRVRFRGRGWMEAVEPDGALSVDEGFACVPENGSVVRAVRANDVGATGAPACRVRRWDDGSSEGTIMRLEVDWGERTV